MESDAVAAWASVLKVHATVLPRLDRELQARHGMPITWYDVLLELNAARDRRLTMGELGEVAVVSRTRVSRVVDDLVSAGLVVREANREDRRSAYAVITPAGRQALRKAAPTYLAGIEAVFGAHLRAGEAKAVATALSRVMTAPLRGDEGR